MTTPLQIKFSSTPDNGEITPYANVGVFDRGLGPVSISEQLYESEVISRMTALADFSWYAGESFILDNVAGNPNVPAKNSWIDCASGAVMTPVNPLTADPKLSSNPDIANGQALDGRDALTGNNAKYLSPLRISPDGFSVLYCGKIADLAATAPLFGNLAAGGTPGEYGFYAQINASTQRLQIGTGNGNTITFAPDLATNPVVFILTWDKTNGYQLYTSPSTTASIIAGTDPKDLTDLDVYLRFYMVLWMQEALADCVLLNASLFGSAQQNIDLRTSWFNYGNARIGI